MATAARSGFGTTLKYDPAGPDLTSFVAIAEVVSISPNPVSDDVIDATSMDSPAGTAGLGHREFIPSIGSDGQVSITANFIATAFSTLRALRQKVISWRITFPGAQTYTFNGILVSMGQEIPFDGKMQLTITVQVTGNPTVA